MDAGRRLESWSRLLGGGDPPERSDARVLLLWALGWFALAPCASVLVGPLAESPLATGVALSLLVASAAVVGATASTCAEPERAVGRAGLVATGAVLSAVIVGVAARFDALGDSLTSAWWVPPALMLPFALLRAVDGEAVVWVGPSAGRYVRPLAAACLVCVAVVGWRSVVRPALHSVDVVVVPAAACDEPRRCSHTADGYIVQVSRSHPYYDHPGGHLQSLSVEWEKRSLTYADGGDGPRMPLDWPDDAPVEMLYDAGARTLDVLAPSHAARFSTRDPQHLRPGASWRPLLPQPRRSDPGLCVGALLGAALALLAMRHAERLCAPFARRDAWRTGRIPHGGDVEPDDGAPLDLPAPPPGAEGPVVTARHVASETPDASPGGPYRSATLASHATVFVGTAAALDARIAHVRAATAAWALVVAAVSLAPALVAALAGR